MLKDLFGCMYGGKTEGKIMVADSLLHHMGTNLQRMLPTDCPYDERNQQNTYYNNEPHHNRFILL